MADTDTVAVASDTAVAVASDTAVAVSDPALAYLLSFPGGDSRHVGFRNRLLESAGLEECDRCGTPAKYDHDYANPETKGRTVDDQKCPFCDHRPFSRKVR